MNIRNNICEHVAAKLSPTSVSFLFFATASSKAIGRAEGVHRGQLREGLGGRGGVVRVQAVVVAPDFIARRLVHVRPVEPALNLRMLHALVVSPADSQRIFSARAEKNFDVFTCPCAVAANDTCRTRGRLPCIDGPALLFFVEEGRTTHPEHKVS